MYIIYTDPNSQGLQNIFKIWVTFTFEKRKNGSARTGLRCSSKEGREEMNRATLPSGVG